MLYKDMQPPTRQRSLALIQSLNRLKFESGKSISEQLPQFELLIREYERTSRSTYPDDLKVAAIIAALPGQLQVQVQMGVTENTTYEQIKQKIELFQQVTTQWSIEPGLRMPTRAETMDDKGPMAMEVHLVQKGFKGKSKDGKFGGKGRFFDSKGKGKGGKGKGYGWTPSGSWARKGKEKGKKGGKGGGKGKGKQDRACFICGQIGHLAKECWRAKVQRVEESATPSQSVIPTSTTAASSSSSAMGPSRVKRVSLLECESPMVFDLTEQRQVEGEHRVCMIVELDEIYGGCDVSLEEVMQSIPPGVPAIAMDAEDSETGNEARVHVVKEGEAVEPKDVVVVTLDSGADVSVVPEMYGAHGEPGSKHRLRMVDAQGAQIASSGNRRLRLQVMTRDGKQVEFVEDFALGGVSHPLMSMGKLLRQGWSVQSDPSGQPYIRHNSGIEVAVGYGCSNLRHRS